MVRYRAIPTLSQEIRAWRDGKRHVAGIDEVGRGPMAGPVVAAATILDPLFAAPWWSDLRDSKMLSALQRSKFHQLIRDTAAVGVGLASHEEIDGLGLSEATRQAMLRALDALPRRPDFLLIDAVSLPEDAGEQHSLVHGDALCISIAAASIVAKVERDRMMDEYDRTYPEYGFGRHRGYVTRDHLRALERHGPCPIHRRSFTPVREYLERHS